MITSHNHSSFTVENQFETQGPAVEQITALPGAHLKVAHLFLDGFRLELIEYLSPRGHPIDLSTNNVGSAHIAFYADDVEQTYRELTERGVRFKGAPVAAAPGRPRVAYFLDPDGITLEPSEHVQPQ